jgi:hypothetical protein
LRHEAGVARYLRQLRWRLLSRNGRAKLALRKLADGPLFLVFIAGVLLKARPVWADSPAAVRAVLLRPKLLKNVARLCTTAEEIHGPVQSRRAMLRSVIGIALVIFFLSMVVML